MVIDDEIILQIMAKWTKYILAANVHSDGQASQKSKEKYYIIMKTTACLLVYQPSESRHTHEEDTRDVWMLSTVFVMHKHKSISFSRQNRATNTL